MKHIIFAALISTFLLPSCGNKKTEASVSNQVTDNISVPYYEAFSHNDYSRERPLQQALELGFNCVEADCFLIDGRNVVAHDRPENSSNFRFLEDLYLNPLFERIETNGGSVYPDADRPFYLMIDIKRDGYDFYTALKPFLEENADKFCSVDSNGNFTSGPILLFFSGSRPMATLPSQQEKRYAFLDGKFEDLGKGIPASLMPVVSDNYENFLSWNGVGSMPDEEVSIVKDLVDKAHAEGKLIRFWGAPDTEAWARQQLAVGVDIVGVDNLDALATILADYHNSDHK